MSVAQLEQPIISEADKYPRIFQWKTVALVVTALISVILVINICLLIYLNGHPVPPTNLTFANDIVFNSEIITQSSMLRMMLRNMVAANPDIKYQFALTLYKGGGENFTAETIKDSIFRQKNHNLLFIFEAESQQQKHMFGLYSTAQFPIPNADDYNSSIDYYTFQYGENRKSTLFSLESTSLLKTNSTDSEVEKDPSLCPSYNLSEKKNRFTMMDLISVTLDSDSSLSVRVQGKAYRCFDGVKNSEQLSLKLADILGFAVDSEIKISRFEVFYLEE